MDSWGYFFIQMSQIHCGQSPNCDEYIYVFHYSDNTIGWALLAAHHINQ